MKTTTFAVKHQADGVRDPDAPRHTPVRGGAWTPTEERRLCLAVRAMMPQEGDAAESATAAEGAVDGAEKTGLSAGKRRRTGTTALDEPRRLRVVGNFDDVCKIEWPEVAKLMANLRNEHQCREKWFESIDPAVNRSLWTDEEDRELLRSELSWLVVQADPVVRAGLRSRVRDHVL